MFSYLTSKDGEYVTDGDNEKGTTIGEGDVGTQFSKIDNVLLVDGLKHHLFSTSQLCDKGNNVMLKSNMCSIKSAKDTKILFVANRNENIYIMNF